MSLQNGYKLQNGVPMIVKDIIENGSPASQSSVTEPAIPVLKAGKTPYNKVPIETSTLQPSLSGTNQLTGAASTSPNPSTQANSKEDPGFYFENQMEFITFCSIYGKKYEKLIWKKGDEYTKRAQKGIQLFDQGKYAEAIGVLNDSLQFNPVGLSARFEICEAYIMLGDLSSAETMLMNMTHFLITNDMIARFYRRLGFINTEKQKYELASACFRFSRNFIDDPSVKNELSFIREKAGMGVNLTNANKVLTENGIPILKATN